MKLGGADGGDVLSAAGVVTEIALLVAVLPHWSRAVMLIECEVDDASGPPHGDWADAVECR